MRAISRSVDFERIKQLPRRDWKEQDSEDLAKLLTDACKTDHGTMCLRPIQAIALCDLHDNGGLFGSIGVGYGKSLICYLAPTVLQSVRPLLLIPAKLKTKTERELVEYSKHFNITPPKIMSYELLSRDRGQQELLDYNPDLIIADECHRLKNLKAACTKRVKRHFKDHPDAKMLAVSGTITRKSLMDYYHILLWCLKDKAPVPLGWREAKDWSLALDEQLPFGSFRLAPGVLLHFADAPKYAHEKNKKDALNIVRQGYRQRLIETPGVIATSDSYMGSSLLIKAELVDPPDQIHDVIKDIRETWSMPYGKEIMDAVEMWRHAREISCGFYYKWDKQPPKEWSLAQKDWAKFVRKVISTNRKGIDTEFQVANAVQRGEYEAKYYETWSKVRDQFKPNTIAVWLSDHVVQYAKKWLDHNKGICWVEHIAFGEELSRVSGYPFFAAGGKDRLGSIIEEAKGPIIASIASNSEGRNLQRWDKNLIITCQPSAQIFEQLVGRTHRSGQDSDEVTVEHFIGCREAYEGLQTIINQAEFIQNTTNQQQRILYADKDIDLSNEIKELVRKNKFAWKSS